MTLIIGAIQSDIEDVNNAVQNVLSPDSTRNDREVDSPEIFPGNDLGELAQCL